MNHEIDEILEKAGRNNKYQYISLLLLFVLYGSSEYLVVILPFLEAKPKVEFFDTNLNTTVITTINYEICENYNYTIVKELTKHSLIYELDIYCDKTLTIVLGICLFSGVMIGSSIAYIFTDRKGRKTTLQIFSTLLIILNIVFYFIYKLIPVFIVIFLSGLFSSIINITILVYVSEMAKKQNLIWFTSTIFCGFSFFGAIYTVIFYFYNEWRNVLLLVIIFLVISVPLIHYYLEESPMFYISHGNEVMFLKSVNNIAKKNGKELDGAELTFTTTHNELNRNDKLSPLEENCNSESEEKSIDIGNLSSRIFVDISKVNSNYLKNKESNGSSTIEDGKDINPQGGFSKCNPLLNTTYLLKQKQRRKMINDFSIFDLITLESQRINFLVLNYIWVVMSFMFYGLSIYIKDLYGNIYETYFFIFLCDPICSFIGALLSNHSSLGRKKTMISLLLISFCSFMTSIFFDQDPNSALFSICMYISRIALIALNCIIFCYTNEIYPTVLRTKGLGFNLTISKLGGISAPFVIENLSPENLLTMFCLINLFAIMFSFMLPETLTRRMAFHPSEMSGIVEESFD